MNKSPLLIAASVSVLMSVVVGVSVARGADSPAFLQAPAPLPHAAVAPARPSATTSSSAVPSTAAPGAACSPYMASGRHGRAGLLAHGYQLQGCRRGLLEGDPLDNGGSGYAGGVHGALMARLNGHLVGVMASGQPLIDRYARADWIAANRAAEQSWHAGYYNTQYGVPVALVVPPTARMQTRWGWGVCQSTMSPIYQQFERPYPGPFMVDPSGLGGMALLPTPRWPSHTDQFGVYYIRGPW